jgi:hypothetical protein
MSTANFRKLAGQDALGDVTTGRINAKGNVANPAGNGITSGTGTIIKSSVERNGGLIKTKILIDITGLTSSASGGDIIGKENAADCFLTQITGKVNGEILSGTMTCVELPAGGDLDIDLFSAVEATGTEDGAVGSLTSTALHANGGNWALGTVKALTAWPVAGRYLYLTVGGTTAGNYSAGRFLIELTGI